MGVLIRRPVRPAARRAAAALLAACALAGASCAKLDPIGPPLAVTGDADFSRYVAIGTSVSMGIQNGGLVDEFQRNSFPALLAARTGANGGNFVQPLVASPGIPPVLELAGFTPTGLPILASRPGAPPAAPYVPRPASGYSNLGISGAVLASALTKTSGNDPTFYFDLVLQGQGTMIRQAIAQDPTFVTVELGVNDAVRVLVGGGDPALLLDPATFETQYTQIMDSLALGAPAARLALFNVPDVTRIPYANAIRLDQSFVPVPGGPAVAFRLRDGAGLLPDSALVLLPAASLVALGYGSPAPGAPPLPDSLVVTVAERRAIAQAAAAYSATIARAAAARGAALVDEAALFDRAFKSGVRVGGASYTFAFLSGGLFSLDGIHPTSLGHGLLANEAIRAINARFGATIAPVDVASLAAPQAPAAVPLAPIAFEDGHR
jgi:lysophospholipase L1-like esterase